MNRACPVCSGANKKFLYQQNFGNKTIALMENYDVVICDSCGMAYADNIPSQDEFNNYYAVMSKWEFNYSGGAVSDDYENYFKKIVNFLTPHLKDKNARILDIGCSTGCLLSKFKENGFNNLLGVDPSARCVETVKKLYNIEAVSKNIYNFNDKNKFDLIILSAVLEHLVDFTTAMGKIRTLLKDDGLLFVEIPDATRFDGYIFVPFQQFSIEHVNYFSCDSIKNLLSKFAFNIIEIKKDENTVNQMVDPDIFVLSRKSEKIDYKLVKDNTCEEKLKSYISLSSKLDLKLKDVIRKKLLDKNKMIIWGVGTHTQMLVGSGLDLSKVLYFVDSNARYWGKKINGVEIKSPQDIKEDVPILISTYSYQDEVARQITEILKLKNEVIKIY
ncbi:MAG: class I SAM-dependent methyltransferase [Candidatus Magasanikbacteria bacterium]